MGTNFHIQPKTLMAIYIGLLLVAIGICLGLIIPSFRVSSPDLTEDWPGLRKFIACAMFAGGGVIALMGLTGQQKASSDARNALLLIALGGIALVVWGILMFTNSTDAKITHSPSDFTMLGGFVLIALGMQQIYTMSALRGSKAAFRCLFAASATLVLIAMLILYQDDNIKQLKDIMGSTSIFDIHNERAESLTKIVLFCDGALQFLMVTILPVSIATAAFSVRFAAKAAKAEIKEETAGSFRLLPQTYKAISSGLLLAAIGIGFFLPSLTMASGEESSIWFKITPLLMLGGGGIIALMSVSGQNQASLDAKNPLLLIALGGVLLAIDGLMMFSAITDLEPYAFTRNSEVNTFCILASVGFVLIAIGLRQVYKLSALRGSQLASRSAIAAIIVLAITIILLTLINGTGILDDEGFIYFIVILFCILSLLPASIAITALGVRFTADSAAAEIEDERKSEVPAAPAE